MAIGSFQIGGLDVSQLRGTPEEKQRALLMAQVRDQRQAQQIQRAIATGAPLPQFANAGTLTQQASQLFHQVQGQRASQYQPTFQQSGSMMTAMFRMMQAMMALSQGFSGFLGGSTPNPNSYNSIPSTPYNGNSSVVAQSGYGLPAAPSYQPQAYTPQPQVYTPAPKPPAKKGGYA